MGINIAIIGGGASGLIAAIKAASMGASVTIFEKNLKLGKKILATGNGRCNYLNIHADKYGYNHPFFVEPIFDQFGVNDTIEFFKKLGVYPKVEDNGKSYPLSEQASSVTEALIRSVHMAKVKVRLGEAVADIKHINDKFVIGTNLNKTASFDKVIIATGGLALPKSGSTGDGYLFGESFGHYKTDVFPALVKLNLSSPYLKETDGVKFATQVNLVLNDKVIQSETGDVLFTKYGISGPTILDISRKANELLLKSLKPVISVKLVSSLSEIETVERFRALKGFNLHDALYGLINRKLIGPVLKESRLNPNDMIDSLPNKDMDRLIHVLFNYAFLIIGSKDFDEAQVTAGGIDISSIDDQSLESLYMSGLYFTGEVMDIDGLCGGYNLQWAWSSGYVAGKSAATTK